MFDTNINSIVAEISKAHNQKTIIDIECSISSQDEAETIQDLLIKRNNLNNFCWKLGASTYGALNGLKLDRTFHAPIPNVFDTGYELPLSELRQAGIECEIAFELIQDIVPNKGEIITEEDLVDCGYHIRPAFEIPETRFSALPPHQVRWSCLFGQFGS